MSEPKLISPMLDNFDMGGPISDHDGVRCCPAMRKNSDDKYIVKIISVPASQTKMDALLLTGAYQDKSAALVYFRQLANGIADEKKILDNLSQLEGFVPFEDCQIVPMDDESGYDVYLLSEYRLTLERQISREPMTQLSAVNLGLDICAALSVCRRSGYMCVDLKPSNIFAVGDKEFKIGDLGFVKLNALKYASLPDMYRSCYTAPEVEDAFAALNETLDIYALGLILYKVFNGGALPFSGQHAPSEKFAAPAYADEEMAEIILKACDPNPAARWQDPVQMGQAIVNYMQKNGVNDTPLTAENFGDNEAEEESVETDELDDAVAEIQDTTEAEESAEEFTSKDSVILADVIADVVDAESSLQTETDDEAAAETVADEPIEIEPVADQIDEEVCEDAVDDAEANADADEAIEVLTTETEEAPVLDADEETEASSEEEEYDNLSFLDGWSPESADDMTENYEGVSDEISEILDQIDALASHPVPDPVVAPEPIEIKVPDPIVFDDEIPDEMPLEEVFGEDPELSDEVVEDETPEEELPYIPKKKRTGLIWCIVLTVLVALAAGAYFFYTLYYLQPVHTLNLSGSEDKLQVELTADIDESQLFVICADSHGNKVTAPVAGGKAVFTGLSPDTAYTVSFEVEGFHELTGMTSKVYSTPVQTKILQLNAVTSSEDGSVILSFAVDGPDSEQWNVIYSAEGEADRVTAFPSHMVTLAGLTVGKEYMFRLEPIDDVYLSEEPVVTYVAKNLVCAENLHVISCADGVLTAQWNTPEGESVTEWTVRCYNETGYDETLTTTENSITFQNVDDTVENIVEVTAADMSVNQRILVSANSITFSDFAVDTSRTDVLTATWNANREIPANGWTVRYSVNGITAPEAITSMENAVQIPVVPNGEYVFTILDDAGNAVLGGPFTHTQAEASAFDGYGVSQKYITARLCKTPAASSWSYRDLDNDDYVNTFSVGEKVSAVLALSHRYHISDDEILVMFAIYDEHDNLVDFSHFTQTWKSLWYQNYCEVDIPSVPAETGTYNVIIYFNGTEVGSQKFEITA